MHIKFTKHGKGSSVKATKYLMQERDHAGEKREEVEVLEGTPELFAAMCDTLNFSKRYESAVVAWHPDDHPTPEQFRQFVDDFKRLALGGVNAPFLAVRHDNHLHILIGRVDLDSGKAFNPAPPGWEKDFDALRSYYDHANNWARPDDPARQRSATQKPENLDRKTAKEQITNWLTELVKIGEVTNRAEVIKRLENLGEITRQGADYVSVKINGLDKALRLKGGLYDSAFSAVASDFSEQLRAGERESPAEREQRIAELQNQFEQRVTKRTEYNEKRFRRPQPAVEQEFNHPTLAPDTVHGDLHCDSFGERLGSQQLLREQSHDSTPERIGVDSVANWSQGRVREIESRVQDDKSRVREDAKSVRTTQTTTKTEEVIYAKTNTTRSPIAELIAEIDRIAERTKQLISRAVEQFNEVVRIRTEATRDLAETSYRLERETRQIEQRTIDFESSSKSVNHLIEQRQQEQKVTQSRGWEMSM